MNCLEPLHSSYICSFTQWCYRYLLNALYAPSTVTGFRGKKQNIHAFLSIRFSEGQQVNNIHENDIVDYMVMSMAKSGFPGGSVVKNPPANAGEVGLILWSGRSPGERNCNPVQYSAWKIPWTEEPGRLPSMVSQKSQTQLSDCCCCCRFSHVWLCATP